MFPLKLVDLAVSISGVPIIQDVSIDFEEAGIVAVVGPNGAGKTTLFDAITGFLRSESGSCCLRGRDITNLLPHEIARLGVARTFQDGRTISSASCLDNVLLSLDLGRAERVVDALACTHSRQTKQAQSRALSLLKKVGLESIADHLAKGLSYGQSKLLGLACCLGRQPEVVLLDEPIGGVSPSLVERIRDIIRAIKREGRLVVFIEHDLRFVSSIADRVVVLDQGRVVFQGLSSELFDRPEVLSAYVGR